MSLYKQNLRKPWQASIRISFLLIIILLSVSSCNRQDLWENNYTIPEVTVTSASATATSITFTWTDPPITEMKAIYITCTDTSTSSVVHTGSVTEGVETYTITDAEGIISNEKYNINIKVTDKYGKSSPGTNFSITVQPTPPEAIHFIYTPYELNAIRGGIITDWDLIDTYNLMADLDLNVLPYNTDPGWEPISIFTGTFEGNGHTIRNLFINRATSQIGLFGRVNGGTIRNLNLVNVNIVGAQYTGGLIGYNENLGTVSGCSVTGTINGGADSVGGLIGFNLNCSINSSYTEVTVTGAGNYIGGLIGYNSGTHSIENSYAICNITATLDPSYNIGGLVGVNNISTITGSYSRGTITAAANNIYSVGGLVGNISNGTQINNSYSEVNVTGTGHQTGGLIGFIRNNSASIITINNCHATGNVNSNSYRTGGLIGYIQNSGDGGFNLNNCYATGDVTSTNINTGGLIGYNHNETTGTIILYNCDATGDITGNGDFTGGLIGYNNNVATGSITLEFCDHTTGSVTGDQYTGGLVGYNINTNIASCTSSGNVTGNNYVGGLVGRNESAGKDIGYSSSSCAVTGHGLDVGGLVGGSYNGNIKASHATGNVVVEATSSGMAEIYIGGLAGYYTSGNIDQSYATGNINVTIFNTGTDSVTGRIGGLIGRAGGNIDKSYTTGMINISIDGTGTKRIHAGGLIGYNESATITLCYHRTGDIDASTGTATYTYLGGLVGINSSGSIATSYAEGIVRANTGSNQGTGGLVGLNTAAINNCYSLCAVEAAGTNTGGFVGYNPASTITNSYSAGWVGGISANKGGFCGLDNAGSYTSCYYDSLESGQSDTGKGEPRTTSAMKTQSNYFGWEFATIWTIGSLNNGYPYIRLNPPQ